MLPSWAYFPVTKTLQQREYMCWHLWTVIWSYAEEMTFLDGGACLIIMFGPHLSIGLFVSSADHVFSGTRPTCVAMELFRGKWDWYCPSDFQNHMWTIRAEYFNRSKKLYVLAMQWTVELFYEACLLTYKLNNFKLIWHLNSYILDICICFYNHFSFTLLKTLPWTLN